MNWPNWDIENTPVGFLLTVCIGLLDHFFYTSVPHKGFVNKQEAKRKRNVNFMEEGDNLV